MKKQIATRLARLLSLSLWLLAASPAFAQGTAFTYQGRLTDNAAPANGGVELQCTLWNALSGGTQVAAATPATTVVTVTNGLFTVLLDFGVTAFDGSDRYLQIEARTTIGPFTLLTPRQKITATPYALLAGKLSGTVASNGLGGTYGNAVTFSNTANIFNGTFAGSGSGLSNVNATTLLGTIPAVALSNAWKLGGNAGTTAGASFLGTTDNQALELKVAGRRALQLEPIITITNVFPGGSVLWSNAPNVIGGSSANGVEAGVAGAFIGGGGSGYYADSGAGYQFVGPLSNHVSGAFGTIGGGGQNAIQLNALLSTIGGGLNNTIQVDTATIGGGRGNTIRTNASSATIGGGSDNTSSGQNATVGGGDGNTGSGSWSTVGGGQQNISSNSYATVGGGTLNFASGFAATVGGGYRNNSSQNYATVGGGHGNNSSFFATTVGGGQLNVSSASYATVPGGFSNNAAGLFSFAAGRRAKANHRGAFVWADPTDADFASTADNQFCIRASGGVQLSGDTPMFFASTLSQKINLYGTTFGIGIQSGVQYSRIGVGGGFGWYAGGVHNDNSFNAGGGITLMTLTAGGLVVNGTFVSASDRNGKENFAPVQPREVLDKVVALPLSSWNYKADPATRHLGPMAQDFHAAFNLGPDDKHIATVDADGVALAAIQGLNQKVESGSQRAEDRFQRSEVRSRKLEENLQQKEAEIAELKRRFAALEQLVATLNPKSELSYEPEKQ